MAAWMVDMILVALAVLVMGFIFYKLVFSADEDSRREMALKPKPRFERREAERKDRRKSSGPAPDGVERRVGPRR